MSAALDQAQSLRDSQDARNPLGERAPLLAVASGKGGVGKTFLSVNLALALREMGQAPILLDLDWGLANVDVALGIAARRHAGHVLTGECALEEALVPHQGLRILANGCGESGLTRFTAEERAALIHRARLMAGERGIVIADTHPGIGAATLEVLADADAAVVVAGVEPTALTDTYALFKVLKETRTTGRFGVVVNNAPSAPAATDAAAHLSMVAQRFLGAPIEHWGDLLADPRVPLSIRAQRPILLSEPSGATAESIRSLARLALGLIQAHGSTRL